MINKFRSIVEALVPLVSSTRYLSQTGWVSTQARSLPSVSRSREEFGGTVQEHYMLPEGFLEFSLTNPMPDYQGYFQFGANTICFGRTCGNTLQLTPDAQLHDVLNDVRIAENTVELPFNPDEVVRNLQMERYNTRVNMLQSLLRRAYYQVRPYTTRTTRSWVQKFNSRNWEKQAFPKWPVDTTVENIHERLLLLTLQAKQIDKVPFIWFWPDGASGCVTMTHDVETTAGRDFCSTLMDMDDAVGIKASFQVVPEDRYEVTPEYLASIRERGFEVVVQDLNHDGMLYDDRAKFLDRVKKINAYGDEWGAKGFRAAVLYRNPEWFDSLQFAYEMSVPNVAHLDPQSGGCCTVMPYFIGNILEIPVTTTQDYMMFHIIKAGSIDLWKKQLDTILQKNGMASFIVHPDYVIEPEHRRLYEQLLAHLQEKCTKSNVWSALPQQINSWWRQRSGMRLEKQGGSWRIVGEGAERAKIAYARNVDGKLVYELEKATA